MDQQNSRSCCVDSRHCREEADGSFHLPLCEHVELADGHACYSDDLTISGTSPNCDTHTRLFLYEYTPKGWDFTGPVRAYSPFDTVQVGGAGAHVLTVAPHTHTTNNTRAYHCPLPAPHGDVYFDLDDTQLHFRIHRQPRGCSRARSVRLPERAS